MKARLARIFSSKIYSISITVLLVCSLLVIIGINRVNKIDRIYSGAVPHIELQNTMIYSGKFATGKIVGFVAFENIELQPKDIRQYIIIEGSQYGSESERQVYTVQEVFAMQAIAPRYSEQSILKVKSEDNRILDLIDENGNLYEVNKVTREVIFIDAGGDITKLITDQTAYRDFIVSWLK